MSLKIDGVDCEYEFFRFFKDQAISEPYVFVFFACIVDRTEKFANVVERDSEELSLEHEYVGYLMPSIIRSIKGTIKIDSWSSKVDWNWQPQQAEPSYSAKFRISGILIAHQMGYLG
jgi:hypothetical protein